MSDRIPTETIAEGYVLEVQAVITVRPASAPASKRTGRQTQPLTSLPTDGWPIDPVEFGKAVREARRRLDLSQFEFAERVGIGITTLGTIEKGRRRTLRRTLRHWIVTGFERLGISPPQPFASPAHATNQTKETP